MRPRDDLFKPLEVFAMEVFTFCSPSAVQFVKHRNVKEFSEEFPQAEKTIMWKIFCGHRTRSGNTSRTGEVSAFRGQICHSNVDAELELRSNTDRGATHGIGYENLDVFIFLGVFMEEIYVLLGDIVPTKKEVCET